MRESQFITADHTPARAGMDPPVDKLTELLDPLPRRRGDGPYARNEKRKLACSPPHARGWTTGVLQRAGGAARTSGPLFAPPGGRNRAAWTSRDLGAPPEEPPRHQRYHRQQGCRADPRPGRPARNLVEAPDIPDPAGEAGEIPPAEALPLPDAHPSLAAFAPGVVEHAVVRAGRGQPGAGVYDDAGPGARDGLVEPLRAAAGGHGQGPRSRTLGRGHGELARWLGKPGAEEDHDGFRDLLARFLGYADLNGDLPGLVVLQGKPGVRGLRGELGVDDVRLGRIGDGGGRFGGGGPGPGKERPVGP